MNGVKTREFMEEFIVVAANLHRKHNSKEVPKDEAALINYLQKMYGQNVDFEGLTTDVLKQSNFIRSPHNASQTKFLRCNSGKGGWGKRVQSSSTLT